MFKGLPLCVCYKTVADRTVPGDHRVGVFRGREGEGSELKNTVLLMGSAVSSTEL